MHVQCSSLLASYNNTLLARSSREIAAAGGGGGAWWATLSTPLPISSAFLGLRKPRTEYNGGGLYSIAVSSSEDLTEKMLASLEIARGPVGRARSHQSVGLRGESCYVVRSLCAAGRARRAPCACACVAVPPHVPAGCR